jgi:hypothetical protein
VCLLPPGPAAGPPPTPRLSEAGAATERLNSGFVDPLFGLIPEFKLPATHMAALFNDCGDTLMSVLDDLGVPEELRVAKGLNRLFRDIPLLLLGHEQPEAPAHSPLASVVPGLSTARFVSVVDQRLAAIREQVFHLHGVLQDGLTSATKRPTRVPYSLLQHGRSLLAELERLISRLSTESAFVRELDDQARHFKVEINTWLVHLQSCTPPANLSSEVQLGVDSVRQRWHDINSAVFDLDLGLKRLPKPKPTAASMLLGNALLSLREAVSAQPDKHTTRMLDQLQSQVRFQIKDRALEELVYACLAVAGGAATGVEVANTSAQFRRLQDLLSMASDGLAMDLERARLQYPSAPESCALRVLPGTLHELAKHRSGALSAGGTSLLADLCGRQSSMAIASAGACASVAQYDLQSWLAEVSSTGWRGDGFSVARVVSFLQSVFDRRSRVEDAIRASVPISFSVEPPSLQLIDLVCAFVPGRKASLAQVLVLQANLDRAMRGTTDSFASSSAANKLGGTVEEGLAGVDSFQKPCGQSVFGAAFLNWAGTRIVKTAERLASAARPGQSGALHALFSSTRDCIPLSLGVGALGVSFGAAALSAAIRNCTEADVQPSSSRFLYFPRPK